MRIHRMKKEKKKGRREGKKERMNESIKVHFHHLLEKTKVVDISKVVVLLPWQFLYRQYFLCR